MRHSFKKLSKSLVQTFGYCAIKVLVQNLCMIKYEEMILSILSKTEIKSTNEILEKLQKKANKVINWHAFYRVLMELQSENKIERLESKAGFFWKKK
jgi:hypothetical protein